MSSPRHPPTPWIAILVLAQQYGQQLPMQG